MKHVVHVHSSVQQYSLDFAVKLRRNNYVSPKHYLDYQQVYLSLYEDRMDFITAQVIEKIHDRSSQRAF